MLTNEIFDSKNTVDIVSIIKLSLESIILSLKINSNMTIAQIMFAINGIDKYIQSILFIFVFNLINLSNGINAISNDLDIIINSNSNKLSSNKSFIFFIELSVITILNPILSNPINNIQYSKLISTLFHLSTT